MQRSVQAKLEIGSPGDDYEREADRIAREVVGAAGAHGTGAAQGPLEHSPRKIQTQRIQTQRIQADASGDAAVVPGVDHVVRSPGRPLDASARNFMEQRFGHDFSHVRIHTDAGADRANRDLHARAFTVGSDIAFRQQQYDPGSTSGKLLLAHELAHTLQQGASAGGERIQRQTLSPEPPDTVAASSPAEKEKERPFAPATGTKNTKLKGRFGDFSVDHGLTKLPDKTKSGSAGFGEYSIKITMTPNSKTGTSKIGFLQVYRQGKTGGGWAKKEGENFLTAEEAKRTEQKAGWAVDRANPTRDKTSLYGMHKDSAGDLQQYSYTTVGEFNGSDAVLGDTPAVADPDRMEFTSTPMDITDGTQFGAIAWGFVFDSARRKYSETTPRLISSIGARAKGRDRAMEVWDKVVATSGSGIDKIPHK